MRKHVTPAERAQTACALGRNLVERERLGGQSCNCGDGPKRCVPILVQMTAETPVNILVQSLLVSCLMHEFVFILETIHGLRTMLRAWKALIKAQSDKVWSCMKALSTHNIMW